MNVSVSDHGVALLYNSRHQLNVMEMTEMQIMCARDTHALTLMQILAFTETNDNQFESVRAKCHDVNSYGIFSFLFIVDTYKQTF